ncbi:MAG: hypothetical protein ABH838_01885 [Actinomycetota bacterium]
MRPSRKRASQAAKRTIAVLAAAVLCVSIAPAVAARDANPGKIVIFVIDKVSIQELQNAKTPYIKSLINQGAVGLTSIRAEDITDTTALYLTVGAGNKAIGVPKPTNTANPPVLLEGFGARERFGGRATTDIYYERTGRTYAYPRAANLSISALMEANQTEQTEAIPGSLGQALRAAGLKTAAVGNADTLNAYGRSVIDLVMDERGQTDFGVLGGEVLQRDTVFPSGYRTDPDKLYAAFEAAYGRTDLIAVEWGDTTRIRSEDGFMTTGREQTLILKSLAQADLFLGRMLDSVNLDNDLVIILTPSASELDIKNNRLVMPTVMAGRGMDKGLLTSASTRRDAAIINVDIAPTILKHFGVEQPGDMTGRPAYAAVSLGDTLAYAVATSENWVTVRNLMNPVLRAFAYWDIAILALFMVLLLVKNLRPYAAKLRWLLLTVPIIPLVTLLLPILNYGPVALVFVEIIVLTAALVFLVYKLARKPIDALGMISLSVVTVILVDLLFGSPLAKNAILGYSVINGARFYGLGNEFSGALIGAVIVAAFYVISAREGSDTSLNKVAAISLLAVTTLMVGLPQFGAEFGGLLALLAGGGLFAVAIIRGGIKLKDMLLLAAASLGVAALFVLFDAAKGADGGSHVGRLVSQMRTEGLSPLLSIVRRKLEMNIRLVQFAFWNWVNITSAIAIGLAFYGLKNLLQLVFQRYPHSKIALISGLVACIAALLLNDSGVVSMAMIFLYLVPPMLFLMTYEIDREV